MNRWPTMWSQLHPLSLLSVLISDTRTWSNKKQGEECENSFGNWTVLLYWMDPDLCIRDGWWTADPQCGVGLTHEVSSSVLICDAKTWSTEKTMRRVWKLFQNWTVSALNGSWTVYQRRDVNSWPDLVHQKVKRESCFGNLDVLLWWMDLKQSTREGWLIAYPQYNMLAVLSHFLSRNRNGTFIQVSCYVSF